MTRRLVDLSKLLSFMLRHEPAKFGLVLDAEGFTPLEEVLRAVQQSFADATLDDLVAVVTTIEPDKQRFSIVETEIRANYGHSVTDRIAQSAAVPPALLFHGTHDAAVAVILRDGLKPMRRQYVHMTPAADLARRVGARRGKPMLIEVDAGAALAAGVAFYRANENFWLADEVPASFLRRVCD